MSLIDEYLKERKEGMTIKEYLIYKKNKEYKDDQSNFIPFLEYRKPNTLQIRKEKKKINNPMQTYLSIFDKGALYGF
jgi:hypothetical protein